MSKNYLAFDLGASSGRAIVGTLDNGKISLREIHRFTNGPVAINGGLFWNLPGLFTELKTGLAKAVQEGIELAGIAIDTWGVDYTFIDADGFPVGLPRNYRDPRTEDVMPFTFDKIAKDKIYELTGIQFMSLNTIFQLAASVRDNDKQLLAADKLLFMPNALTYLFCGNVSAEYSITTTSALYNPKTGDWAWEIIDALGLKRSLFPTIVPSGTVVGTVSEQLQEELKCGPLPVILIGSHDTASAVAAVPVQKGTNWAYLSSGTWSLIGLELDKPLITAESGEANYTNEGGVGGKIRFLKNIMGLWLIQECRNEWIRQGTEYSWGDLVKLAQ
ncbi:MAG: rhamnulokinase, partial [Victivallales bacterium]|nr:rhamnulokinase [Victivallales bacterium]